MRRLKVFCLQLQKVHPLSLGLSLGLCHITLWNTRELDDSVRQVCDTCLQTEAKPKAVWSKAPCANTQVSQCCWSENCCVQACKEIRRNTNNENAREMCSCWETVNKVDTDRARREGWEETHSHTPKEKRSITGGAKENSPIHFLC